MRNYDQQLLDAKRATTAALLDLQRANPTADVGTLAAAIDRLNSAWDELTDCLVRQRAELRNQLLNVIDELAEEKKETT